jgi:hypothetical protein
MPTRGVSSSLRCCIRHEHRRRCGRPARLPRERHSWRPIRARPGARPPLVACWYCATDPPPHSSRGTPRALSWPEEVPHGQQPARAPCHMSSWLLACPLCRQGAGETRRGSGRLSPATGEWPLPGEGLPGLSTQRAHHCPPEETPPGGCTPPA